MTKAKAQQLRTKVQTPSYASVAAVAGPSSKGVVNPSGPNQTNAWKGAPADHALIIHTALIQAHIAEAASPGCFQAVLDSIYKSNGLPRVIIPEDARMTKAIVKKNNGSMAGASTSADITTDNDNQSSSGDEMDLEMQRSAKRDREGNSDSDSESLTPDRPSKVSHRATTPTEELSPSATPNNPTDEPQQPAALNQEQTGTADISKKRTYVRTGIKLYAPMSLGLAKVISQERLKDMIATQVLKYHYTEKLAADRVRKMIQDNEIDLTKLHINKVTKDKFRKITQGFYKLNP